MRRPSTPFLVSLAVHGVVVAFFVQALVLKKPLFDLFQRGIPAPELPIERIGFLNLPTPSAEPPTPGRRGGNGRPISEAPRPVIAPPSVPTTVPTVPKNPGKSVDEDEPGTGMLIGGGGKLRGIQPRYSDPRLWGGPGVVATAPKSSTEQLDSVIKGDIGRYNDSMRVATGAQRDPTDWTVQRGGQKYGVDRKYIRIGPVSIPTAVLALLPLNVTSNPNVSQRERAYNAMHGDIMSHAEQGLNEMEFQKAVRSIRQRKERERQEQEKQKAAEKSSAAPGSSESTSSP